MRRRNRNYKLIGKKSLPKTRERVESFMKWREEIVFRKWKHDLHRQWSRNHAENSAGSFAHHFLQTSQRKKSEVCSIEDSAVHIVELSEKQAETNEDIGDVRYGNDDLA